TVQVNDRAAAVFDVQLGVRPRHTFAGVAEHDFVVRGAPDPHHAVAQFDDALGAVGIANHEARWCRHVSSFAAAPTRAASSFKASRRSAAGSALARLASRALIVSAAVRFTGALPRNTAMAFITSASTRACRAVSVERLSLVRGWTAVGGRRIDVDAAASFGSGGGCTAVRDRGMNVVGSSISSSGAGAGGGLAAVRGCGGGVTAVPATAGGAGVCTPVRPGPGTTRVASKASCGFGATAGRGATPDAGGVGGFAADREPA